MVPLPKHLSRVLLALALCSTPAWSAATAASPEVSGNVTLTRTSLNRYGVQASIDGHPLLMTVDTGAPLTDVLSRYGAVIDWTRRTVYFNTNAGKRAQIGRTATSHGWTAIPMEFTNHRHYAVPCTLGNTTYHPIVDTGAALTMIDKSVWPTDITMGRPRAYMNGINGITAISPVIIKSWSIGTFPMANSAVAVGKFQGGFFEDTTPSPGRVVGILGSEWLAFR